MSSGMVCGTPKPPLLTINKHDIPHIPVDTLKRPLNFHDNCERMLNKICGMVSQDVFNFRNLLDHQISAETKYGFKFLNSDHNDKLFQEIDSLKEKILKTVDDEAFYQISALEREINEKREDEILNNIYNYCKEHAFGQGMLFIVSGHRESMLKKN